MIPQELKLRLKFHEEQANRLLQTYPMVVEFFHHLTQIELMKQQSSNQNSRSAHTSDLPESTLEQVSMNGGA